METQHIQHRKGNIRQEKETTTTTTIEPGKSYADVAAHRPSKSSSRRSSFSQQAQQLIPNVSKQQLAYGLPIGLAIILSLLFLGFRSSIMSYFQPPPPPTLSQQFAHKLDTFGHGVGGEYWESLKHKTFSLHQSASELVDSLSIPNVPGLGLENLKKKAEDLKVEAEKQYKAANAKANEYAKSAAGKAGIKVDHLKENGSDKMNRAGLHASDVAENVRHAVNEASEAVRHAAVETQEALRHRAASMANTAGHKVQDVKDGFHNIKQKIENKL